MNGSFRRVLFAYLQLAQRFFPMEGMLLEILRLNQEFHKTVLKYRKVSRIFHKNKKLLMEAEQRKSWIKMILRYAQRALRPCSPYGQQRELLVETRASDREQSSPLLHSVVPIHRNKMCLEVFENRLEVCVN